MTEKKEETGHVHLSLPDAAGRRMAVLCESEGIRLGYAVSKAEGKPMVPGEYVLVDGEPGAEGEHAIRGRVRVPGTSGPSKTVTPAYREGWDRIFGAAHAARATN